MKPSKHAKGERTGRMVNNHGHWEYRYDPDPVDPNPPVLTESMAIVELRRRHDGWTAERQRVFLNVLANTGSVAHAAEAADITPRSAYRLRNHPKGAAFARAWEAALMTAANRLTAVAFERAITGTPRAIWRDGRIVAETSIPSDQMLMFLLRHLSPALFGDRGVPTGRAEAVGAMAGAFPSAMAGLIDTDVDADLLDDDDYRPRRPHEHQA
jgi:hypothetical protein